MPTSTLTSKGQTTIPREIRDHLAIGTGDRIEFVIDEHGRVVVSPATLDVRSIKGIFPPPKRPVSVDRMNEAIRRRGARKGERC